MKKGTFKAIFKKRRNDLLKGMTQSEIEKMVEAKIFYSFFYRLDYIEQMLIRRKMWGYRVAAEKVYLKNLNEVEGLYDQIKKLKKRLKKIKELNNGKKSMDRTSAA